MRLGFCRSCGWTPEQIESKEELGTFGRGQWSFCELRDDCLARKIFERLFA